MTLRVLLADDHDIVRQGLRTLLESEPDVELAGEARDGLELLSLVEQNTPDVAVVDIRMPGLDGLEATSRIREQCPATRVIILSMYSDEAYVVQAFRNGAWAYVLKDAEAPELLKAIRTVSAGEQYLSPPLSERGVQSYLQKSAETAHDPYHALSPREREVLQLAAEGNSNRAICERLGISIRTVETHRANLMRKIGLRGQTELVRYAMRRGLVTE